MVNLLEMSPREVMELTRLEINEINTTKPVITMPKWGFDEVEDGTVNYQNAFDLIDQFEDERMIDLFTTEATHMPVLLKFKKLHNYNKLHCNTTHKTNKIYEDYSKEIIEQIPEHVTELLQSGFFRLDISFYIKNINQDLDNLDEAFTEMVLGNYKKAIIDTLFKKANRNDNSIKEMGTKISKSFTDFEFILLRITRLSKYQTYQDPLLAEFLQSGGIIK